MFLLNITNADISLILNVAFWCIIGMIAIFALVGAIKGFWKSVVGAVVQLILLVVVMFVTPGVANLIGNIDVSGFTSSSSATIGNVEIQITSIREMICQWLTASGHCALRCLCLCCIKTKFFIANIDHNCIRCIRCLIKLIPSGLCEFQLHIIIIIIHR